MARAKSTIRRTKRNSVEPAEQAGGASAATAPVAAPRTPEDVDWLLVRGATQNNLKNIDVAFPLGRFTCVTGVSGSGKSSLVNDILYAALARQLNKATSLEPGAFAGFEGLEYLDKVIAIDQSPIGRTPRSNPATYIKVFDEIRSLFCRLPDAKLRGYKPGRFSFNVAAARGGGRCEACEGNGANRIEMDFLADVWVACPVCGGHRFTRETLAVHYKGKSIADVLEMDVQEALAHFDNVPRICGMLQTLHDVGLDYIKLGQPSPTLSGGEAQRIKLARELVKKATGRTLYVLDEPTTGLHFEDIRKLLAVLHGFVDAGNTVVVIEHNLDVVKTADWLIDLGPEGGERGGLVVAEGTPEDVARVEQSFTGEALRAIFENGARGGATEKAAGRRRGAEARRSASGAAAGEASLVAPQHCAEHIRVVGARQHNLKDLTVTFPRNEMTVCTGVSGSGKTSFAIDTVFTEGYRRYVESLSAYARQFLGQMAKPRVDHVEGLSPAICIEQKAASKSPRSTVGTITEIYDYMRVLWARIGTPHCVACDVPIGAQTIDEIIDAVLAVGEGAPIMILAPVTLGDGEGYPQLIQRLKRSGFARLRIDGTVIRAEEATTLDARRRHRVEVVVDRTLVRRRARGRIAESIEHALALGDGVMLLLVEAVETVEPAEGGETAVAAPEDGGEGAAGSPAGQIRQTPPRETLFSQKLACPQCRRSYEELSPHHFSFNSHLGWCETCEGLGVQRGAPAAAIIDRPGHALLEGAISGWGRVPPESRFGKMLLALCRHLDVSPQTPLRDWTPEQRRVLMYGTKRPSGGPEEWIDASDVFGPAPRRGKEEPAGLRFQWRGFFPAIDAATRNSWTLRHRLHNAVTEIPCITCRGGRLRPDAAAVRLCEESGDNGAPAKPGALDRVTNPTIVDVCAMPLAEVVAFFNLLRLDNRRRRIAGEVLKEIRDRLQFLLDVGLEYLTLHRAAPTLSGGEAQRIRLASQIGSGLSGVLYVLDEPTIGLHPRDSRRLVAALQKLRNLGNTLLVVEHDREVIQHADRLLDFGPRAGVAGGRIVGAGPAAEFLQATPAAVRRKRPQEEDSASTDATNGESLTRAYLTGGCAIPIPSNRRSVAYSEDVLRGESEAGRKPVRRPGGKLTKRAKRRGAVTAVAERRPLNDAHSGNGEAAEPPWLILRGARQNNLKDLTLPIPLGRFVCVTGVSGSGKSSLVNDILYPALASRLGQAALTAGEHDELLGLEQIDKVINVDQAPIGTTPSSNPATYTGAFDWIRELFARLPDSKVRGYNANRFSFNRPGGRCDACEGHGQKCIEMHFMPDVWVECEVCGGKRYNPETLEIRYKGRSIADVLELRVSEALALFENVPKVRRMLQTLVDVGLHYVQLGQSAPTLSGGEAQRVKLATELGKPDTGRTFYILDEPTTGLHFDDIHKLMNVIHRLVDLGNTVLVVEHNLDVLKCADWIIDLGPEAGDAGGQIVAMGTPEDVVSGAGGRAREFTSHTAAALAPVLDAGPYEERRRIDRAAHAEEELQNARGGYGDVGRDVKMPWQVDGRRWHLEQRNSRCDQPRRWEPAALEYVLELVHKAGSFLPTNWNERASVEVTGEGATTWFLHALTGGEWLLELCFLVPPGTFDQKQLDAQIGLKTLDQRGDLETYGNWSRVNVRPRKIGMEAVVIYVHDRIEIQNPGFRKFIKAAAKAYLSACR